MSREWENERQIVAGILESDVVKYGGDRPTPMELHRLSTAVLLICVQDEATFKACEAAMKLERWKRDNTRAREQGES